MLLNTSRLCMLLFNKPWCQQCALPVLPLREAHEERGAIVTCVPVDVLCCPAPQDSSDDVYCRLWMCPASWRAWQYTRAILPSTSFVQFDEAQRGGLLC
jgi:hypothetical protein